MTAGPRSPHALRRVRNSAPTDGGHRVHLQVQDTPGGRWRLACSSPSKRLELAVGGPMMVSCQRCRNSGLVPAGWLSASSEPLDAGVSRG